MQTVFSRHKLLQYAMQYAMQSSVRGVRESGCYKQLLGMPGEASGRTKVAWHVGRHVGSDNRRGGGGMGWGGQLEGGLCRGRAVGGVS